MVRLRSRRDTPARTPRVALALLALTAASFALATPAHARTVVTLTFGDGSADQYSTRSMLISRGLRATFFVNSGKVGTRPYFMTWPQLQDLYADGNEIGGHTLYHKDQTQQTPDQQREDVCQDRANLLNAGFAATSFAYPYGTRNITSAIVQGCGYNSGNLAGGLRWGSDCTHCDFAESLPPVDPYEIRTVAIRAGVTGAQLADYIRQTEQRGGGWLIFPFNQLCEGCGPYGTSPAVLEDFLNRVQRLVAQGGVQVATMQQAIGGQIQPVPAGSSTPVTTLPLPPRGSRVTVVGRDTIRPRIVRASVSRKRFAVVRKTTGKTAARRGAVIRYLLSEPASVQLRIERALSGKRVRRTCRRPTARLRRARRCTRYRAVGSLRHTSTTLSNRVQFSGRIGKKALRPGAYRVVLTATDAAGNRSRPRSVRFRITRR